MKSDDQLRETVSDGIVDEVVCEAIEEAESQVWRCLWWVGEWPS